MKDGEGLTWMYLGILMWAGIIVVLIYMGVSAYTEGNRFELVVAGGDRVYEVDKKSGDVWKVAKLGRYKQFLQEVGREEASAGKIRLTLEDIDRIEREEPGK